MSTALGSPLLREQEFLERFSLAFEGKGLASRFEFGSAAWHCVSFTESFREKEVAGHGYDADPSIATMKGALELVERKVVTEYFYRNPSETLKNSNGWAVHFSEEQARKAAVREAIERHILLYTFLKSGWREFVLLKEEQTQKGRVQFLVSPYSCNAHFAGLILYRDLRFPGVSFGYMADQLGEIQSSRRWKHAIFEAVSFVERGVETGSFDGETANEIHRECCEWLLNPWQETNWKTDLTIQELPRVEAKFESGLVTDILPGIPNLFYARVALGAFIPLFFQADLANEETRNFLSSVLDRFGLRVPEGRTPVL